jgi:hypothetical protein
MSNAKKETAPTTISVHIKAAEATRVRVGTRWEVIESSLGSLWEDTYTVELKEIKGEKTRQ